MRRRECNSQLDSRFSDILSPSDTQDLTQVSFSCTKRCGGAVLSLPVDTRRQDTHARGAFGKLIIQHIDT